MEFEFDPAKSAANHAKHGLDFVGAQELWEDAMRIEVPARTEDEPRWLVIGRIGRQHWSAVITHREERIRIISARRSRAEEVRIYEG
ncbi:MAG: BrnT family toxin [Solirubrobacteraceae bacterium]